MIETLGLRKHAHVISMQSVFRRLLDRPIFHHTKRCEVTRLLSLLEKYVSRSPENEKRLEPSGLSPRCIIVIFPL